MSFTAKVFLLGHNMLVTNCEGFRKLSDSIGKVPIGVRKLSDCIRTVSNGCSKVCGDVVRKVSDVRKLSYFVRNVSDSEICQMVSIICQ